VTREFLSFSDCLPGPLARDGPQAAVSKQMIAKAISVECFDLFILQSKHSNLANFGPVLDLNLNPDHFAFDYCRADEVYFYGFFIGQFGQVFAESVICYGGRHSDRGMHRK